jgi:hypothetical protein
MSTHLVTAPCRSAREASPSGTAAIARALRSLREACFTAVTADIDEPYRVALYVLVDPGGDPADRFAVAQAQAIRSGTEITHRLCDSTGMTDPFTRPGLARAYAAIRRGEIHGIVAASRTDISTFDQPYEQELRRLRAMAGFLLLAHNETGV